jgi:hypothetical protein
MIDGRLGLMAIWEKYADWDTFFSKITQGQVEKNGATATEIMEQAQRGDKYTATIMRNLDDGLTEPIGTRFFSENMRDPAVEDGKGDFRFKAQGWEAQQTRISRVNALRALLSVVVQAPEFMGWVKPRGILDPMVENAALDKPSILKTPEEYAADQQAMQPQPQAPSPEQEQAAAMGAAVQVEKVAADADKAQADADAKRADVELKRSKDRRETAETVARIQKLSQPDQKKETRQ